VGKLPSNGAAMSEHLFYVIDIYQNINKLLFFIYII